jgi:hypothetical protein
MVNLNFKAFFEEDQSDDKADAVGALTSFLGIDPKDIPEVMVEPKLLSQMVFGKQQISIAPYEVKPVYRNGKCVGAHLVIKPENSKPSYVYINSSLNSNRNDKIKGSISVDNLDKLLTLGLQAQ